jgi:predicted RNase H-like nuclease (RuvC/YqgF family)
MGYTQKESEQAFARLAELLAELDEMQEKGNRLTRAREARELKALKDRAARLTAETQRYGQKVDEANKEMEAAAQVGDVAAQGRALGALRTYSELYALRLGPQQNAARTLDLALKEGALSLDDQLDEIALSNDEFAALEKEVSCYRAEYLACYELCKSFES